MYKIKAVKFLTERTKYPFVSMATFKDLFYVFHRGVLKEHGVDKSMEVFSCGSVRLERKSSAEYA